MSISPIQPGTQTSVPPVRPAVTTAVPGEAPAGQATLDTSRQIHNRLDGVARGGELSNATKLADLKPEELQKLGGAADALQKIGEIDSSVTLGEARALMGQPQALNGIAELLKSRSDLRFSDLVSRGRDGKVRVDPSVFDKDAQELLKSGQLSPQQVSTMKANFTKILKDPSLAKAAMKQAVELLKKRPTIRPEALVQMLTKMRNATCKGQHPQESAMAGDMFAKAAKLLIERPDIQPEDMGKLAESLGKMGKKQKSDGGAGVAAAFGEATKAMTENPQLKVHQMQNLAETVEKRFAGKEDGDADRRLAAFSKGAKLMGSNPNVDAAAIDKMLQQGQQSNPPLQGDKLLTAFDSMVGGLNSGTYTLHGLTNGSPQFDRHGMLKAGPPQTGDNRRSGGAQQQQQQTQTRQTQTRQTQTRPGTEGPRRPR